MQAISAWVALGLLVAGAGLGRAGFDFTTLDVPGAVFSYGLGINNAGQIVGNYLDPTSPSGQTYGFLLSGGGYTRLDQSVTANAINNAGDIVGATALRGYLYSGGVYTTIAVPGSSAT